MVLTADQPPQQHELPVSVTPVFQVMGEKKSSTYILFVVFAVIFRGFGFFNPLQKRPESYPQEIFCTLAFWNALGNTKYAKMSTGRSRNHLHSPEISVFISSSEQEKQNK